MINESEYAHLKECKIKRAPVLEFILALDLVRRDIFNQNVWAYETGLSAGLMAAYYLADFLFHHIDFPPSKARRVRAILNKMKPPRRTNVTKAIKWLKDREKHIDDLFLLLKCPLKKEGQGSLQVGPFLLHNPLHLDENKINDLVEATKGALRVSTDDLAPNFTSVLYGDLIVVEKLGRSNWMAWYTTSKDNISIKHFKGVATDDFQRTLIHELGHRYYKKVLPEKQKKLWAKYHKRASVGVDLRDWVGVDIGLRAVKKKSGWSFQQGGKGLITLIGEPKGASVPVFVAGEGHVGSLFYSFITKVIQTKIGAMPSAYAYTNEEEHFCEALSHKAMGSLHPKSVEAFDLIIKQGESVFLDVGDFKVTPKKSRKTIAAMLDECRKVAVDLGLEFTTNDWGGEYAAFYHNRKAYAFVDLVIGNVFLPKPASGSTTHTPNLKANIGSALNENIKDLINFERMSDLNPSWKD
jgi:hypothetical protein